jgi:hypothetical protein
VGRDDNAERRYWHRAINLIFSQHEGLCSVAAP